MEINKKELINDMIRASIDSIELEDLISRFADQQEDFFMSLTIEELEKQAEDILWEYKKSDYIT